MFFNPILVVICRTLLEAMLNATFNAVVTPIFTAGNFKLMTAFTVAPNIDSIPGDFTEATFTGYAPASGLAPSGPFNMPGEGGMSLQFPLTFAASSPLTSGPQSIVGYWVDDGAGHVLLAELFPVPFGIQHPFDSLTINWTTPMQTLQPTGN